MAKKKTPMVTLTCPEHPELLITFPRVEFHDGRAETDEATAETIIDELADDYGIALADPVPVEEEAPVEEAPAEVVEG
nr:MAG TPA: hypothetical protein [Caudoviricetes sp.]